MIRFASLMNLPEEDVPCDCNQKYVQRIHPLAYQSDYVLKERDIYGRCKFDLIIFKFNYL